MAYKARWLNYTDFETVLLAPTGFIAANPEAASQFDRTVSYESAARFVPLFEKAVMRSEP